MGAMMGLAGLLVLAEAALPNADGAVRRASLILGVASAVLLTTHMFFWLANVAGRGEVEGGRWTVLTDSGTGRRELLRAALVLLALWALVLARRRGMAAFFAMLALAVSADIGHPAAIHPLWAVPAKALHLLAGSTWLGGLLWITLSDRTHARYVEGVRRVSAMALTSVVIVAASGVVQALLFLPNLGALTSSAYGGLVLAKSAGLLVLAGFGAYHRYRVVPRVASPAPAVALRLRTSVWTEVGVMCFVILLGGFLAYVPPARPVPPPLPATAGRTQSGE
jgi:putative copper export protein